MPKRKRLALLSLLLLVSVGSAVVADPLGVLESLASSVEEVRIDVQAVQQSFMLSQEERQKAINIVLMDSQVQEMLEGVDDYNVQVSEGLLSQFAGSDRFIECGCHVHVHALER